MAIDLADLSNWTNKERRMDSDYLRKAVIGAAGMAVGAALVTLIRVAAVDGVETARMRHLAEIASGRAPASRVAMRGDLDCRNLAGAEVLSTE
jgi:hypothetical protein